MVKKDKEEFPLLSVAMNYGQVEEVIKILGSSDEDEDDYEANQSQPVMARVRPQ